MKRYLAVFLSNLQHNIDYVYSQAQQQEIAELTELMPGIVNSENFYDFDLSEVEVIFSTWGMICFSAEQLAGMPNLKAVFYAAGATDAFAMPLLNGGIKLASAWRANAIPVAEFTVAQIILSLKNYFRNSAAITNRAGRRTAPVGVGCYGETVALIGAGAISMLVREMLKAYRLNVIVVPSRQEHRTISLEEAFLRAYVISNHLPDRLDNRNVLTRSMFASMRQGATFLNTGRGAQVDEAGLIEVFKQRPDLTALLDLTWPEPPEDGSELYTLPNIHLSSHIAGSKNDEVHRMADYMIEEYKRFADGKPLMHEVTEKILMTL